jgi:hypothetical protein
MGDCFMKGIRLSHGAVFVTDGCYTVRLLKSGECGPSPITYNSLEWDLRTEPPHTWDYIFEYEIENLPDGGGEKIRAAFEKIYALTEPKKDCTLLFTCTEDFYAKAAACEKLERESEKTYARMMAEGDGNARERIMLSYLPAVAAFVKRKSRSEQTLELIYRLVDSLEKAVESFDFQQEGESFSHRLTLVMRKAFTEYIADK